MRVNIDRKTPILPGGFDDHLIRPGVRLRVVLRGSVFPFWASFSTDSSRMASRVYSWPSTVAHYSIRQLNRC
jgi:hypothetical protein